MNILVYKNSEQIAKAAAAIFAAQTLEKPDSVLGLATGSTPINTYLQLIDLYKAGVLDFSKVKTFNLDEYVGLDKSHNQSYYSFMYENLFNHINISEENVHILNGIADDLDEECENYEQLIENAGGIDLQILGVGNNGHIAFNEPSDSFAQSTHIVTLKDSTIQANKRFFNNADEVPKQALTMGIGTIMKSSKIVLIAESQSKAQAISDMVNGNITPQLPASILKLHSNVTVILDEAAASLL